MPSKLGPNSASGITTVSCTFPEQFAIGGSGGAENSFSGDEKVNANYSWEENAYEGLNHVTTCSQANQLMEFRSL